MPFLKRWIETVSDMATRWEHKAVADDDWRLAAAVLLLHVGQADGVVSPSERRRFGDIARQAFSLDEDAAGHLIAQAMEAKRASNDVSSHAHVLRRVFDSSELGRFVEMLWLMALANGKAGELEETVIWRIAALLGVPDTTMNAIRVAVTAPA